MTDTNKEKPQAEPPVEENKPQPESKAQAEKPAVEQEEPFIDPNIPEGSVEISFRIELRDNRETIHHQELKLMVPDWLDPSAVNQNKTLTADFVKSGTRHIQSTLARMLNRAKPPTAPTDAEPDVPLKALPDPDECMDASKANAADDDVEDIDLPGEMHEVDDFPENGPEIFAPEPKGDEEDKKDG